ncbi:MAG: hypothetical protein HN704_14410 [Bacteroidetes bacterium]|jgi:vacuolar-type H+-ATPase subunit H|nr:hypothetical protein [Bacteroidota bacterium]MBT6684887.1 hypothetical protein [Bacteroidota bacterium]MBT7141691.1 hypothetical protein [Bacteroidota bacterium]MBT7492789.1 hypothetical protein [Bacteroidota bacterium]
MKKIAKIVVIVVLSFATLLYITPLFFHSKINEVIKQEINKSIEAKVSYSDLNLSLLNSFPDFSLRLSNFTIEGIDEFEKDTLVFINMLKSNIDLMSVFSGENLIVKSIIVENPMVFAQILENGNANWDITKESSEKASKEATTEKSDFVIELKNFEIKNASIVYDDYENNLLTILHDINFKLKGNFSEKQTKLSVSSTISAVDVWFEGIRYMNNVNFETNTTIDADFDKQKFTFVKNQFRLNELLLGLDGSFQIAGEDYLCDMKFDAQKTEFKNILSLIPVIYMNDFTEIKTFGELALNGFVKGTYNENVMPKFGIDLKIEKAFFKYPELPKSAENIEVDIQIMNHGNELDATIVDVNKFHLDIGNSKIDMSLHLKNLVSDPAINSNILTNINFGDISSAIPFDNVNLKGTFQSDINLIGSLSSIENEKYHEFNANGNVSLKDFQYSSEEMSNSINISDMQMQFSPEFIKLSSFKSKIGKSDLFLSGKINNYLNFVFKDDIIKADFLASSKLLDLNEFLADEEKPETIENDTSALSAIEIPENVDFTLNSNFAAVLYDKIEIEDFVGKLKIEDGRLEFQGVEMNLLDGKMDLNGFYDSKDISKPKVSFDMQISNFDIEKTGNTFNTIEKIAPIVSSMKGRFSSVLSLKSELDNEMSPVLKTMNSSGNFKSEKIVISNSSTFNKVAELMKSEKYKTIDLKDIQANFTVENGNISVEPFETKFGSNTALISGNQGIDNNIEYRIALSIPRSELSENMQNDDFNKLLGENITFDINISGELNQPKVSVDFKKGITNVKENAVEAAKLELQKQKELLKKKLEDEKQKLKEKAENLIKKAEKEAEEIKRQAKKLADKILKEADAEADKIESKAKNKSIIEKKIAKKAAKKLRDEARKNADKIVSEANKKAESVLQKAKS